MGIPPDGAGGGGGSLDGTEGGAAGGKQSTEKGVGQAGAEHAGVMVIDQSMQGSWSSTRAWIGTLHLPTTSG